MNHNTNGLHRIESLVAGVLGSFLLVALALSFWAIVRAPAFEQRSDNPRRVEAELQIRRGRILDANGVVLAESIVQDGVVTRSYPVNVIGPAVGYYSFRHGTAGIEQGYNDVLRGDEDPDWDSLWREALHRPQTGQDVKLTINADWQSVASALMQGHSGALVILDSEDAAVKSMISHPGYNPNELDANFDALMADTTAPLFNRVTQGFYQPGIALQPFILAAAIDREAVQIDTVVEDPTVPVMVRNTMRGCRETPPEEATWVAVLQSACPAPMMQLSSQFDVAAFNSSIANFGFFTQPDFPIQTAQVTSPRVSDLNSALLGQEFLAVTPLQMARAWLAFANEGRLLTPYLVREVQNAQGTWQTPPREEAADQAISPSAASIILSSLRVHQSRYLEHAATALSGPEDAMIAWYLGFTPAQNPRYAVVVVIEATHDESVAQQIGRAALQATLGEN